MTLLPWQPPPKAHRKRRLRKKYQLGEFQPIVLRLEADFVPPLSDMAAGVLWDALIDFVESRNLGAFGAEGPSSWAWYIRAYKDGRRRRNGDIRSQTVSPAQDDVFAFIEWAKAEYPKLGLASSIVNFSAKLEKLGY